MTPNNVSLIVSTPNTFVQQVQSQTKTHGVLWHVVNAIFLGFPALFEEIGDARGRGRTKHEVTLLEPISMGTDVEKEVLEAKELESDIALTPEGRLNSFLTTERSQAKSRLERFSTEIKPKLEKISTEAEWFGVQRAVRQDVLNCRVQLAALAPECPQREEARKRLLLAVLRQEGVKIAMKAIITERIKIEKAEHQAEEDAAPEVNFVRELLNKPTTTDDYRMRYGESQIQAARQPFVDRLNQEKANIVREAHQNLMAEARHWRVETANEQIRDLTKLLVS